MSECSLCAKPENTIEVSTGMPGPATLFFRDTLGVLHAHVEKKADVGGVTGTAELAEHVLRLVMGTAELAEHVFRLEGRVKNLEEKVLGSPKIGGAE